MLLPGLYSFLNWEINHKFKCTLKTCTVVGKGFWPRNSAGTRCAVTSSGPQKMEIQWSRMVHKFYSTPLAYHVSRIVTYNLDPRWLVTVLLSVWLFQDCDGPSSQKILKFFSDRLFIVTVSSWFAHLEITEQFFSNRLGMHSTWALMVPLTMLASRMVWEPFRMIVYMKLFDLGDFWARLSESFLAVFSVILYLCYLKYAHLLYKINKHMPWSHSVRFQC